jgi:hypothetical protein
MEIREFQHSRDKKFQEFKDEYNSLKTGYSETLLLAIQETDPSQQQTLVNKVLDLNSSLSELLRGFIAEINKGTDKFNPKDLDELMQDLITYQKQYHEIQKSKDKLETLKIIYAQNRDKLKQVTFQYNALIIILILLAIVVFILGFTTHTRYSVSKMISSSISATPSQ